MKSAVSILFAACSLLLLSGCEKPAPPPPPPEAPISAEEAEMRREARALGTRLYTTAEKVESAKMTDEQQRAVLKPVYTDIEQFIFKRMSDYSSRISSITVTYSRPSIQCIIYVTPGDEEELKSLKKSADSIVGRVIENLPIVKYLMIKQEQA